MFLEVSTILASLLFAIAVIAYLSRQGAQNGLLLVGAAFLVFAYGPAINILRGETYYSGISLANIAEPLTGFALAMAGIATAQWAMPLRLAERPSTSPRDRPLLPPLLLGAAGYGLFQVATRLSGSWSANKLDQVELAGATHYPYLLLQTLIISTYFMCRTRLSKRLWLFNMLVYITYALATSERDFIFVLAAILVHREAFLNKRRNMRAVALGSVGAVVATALATSRQAARDDSILNNVLNQGSILFVDSNLHRAIPEVFGYRYGETYMAAVLRPIGLSSEPPLADWFLSWYAPGAASGYGFSLTGEAFWNFGFPGVLAVFFLLGAIHRVLMNRSPRSDFACYLSVVFLGTWLYALRGDFSQIFSTMTYGVILYFLISLMRVTRERLDEKGLTSPGSNSNTANQ